jgi:hypothetical protein
MEEVHSCEISVTLCQTTRCHTTGIIIFIMGLCILLRVLSRFISKTVLYNKCLRCFYLCSLSQHVSAYLMAVLRRIIQNIKRSCYFYNGSVVFSTIMCVSCRKLIAVVFLCIKFLNILKNFVKIF